LAIRKSVERPVRHASVFGVVAVATSAVGWLIRDVILTGYPLYPTTLFPVNVTWRISPEMVNRVHRFIIVWGRWSGGAPVPVLNNWRWIQPWAARELTLNREAVLPVGLFIVLLAVSLQRRKKRSALGISMLLPGIATVVYWFLTSPDPRFLGATLWTLCAISGWLVICTLQSTQSGRLGVICIAICIAFVAVTLPPTPKLALFTPSLAPRTPVVPFRTQSGLSVHLAPGGLCWDDEPPCLIFALKGLELRHPGKLSDGFLGKAWDTFDPGPMSPDFWDAQ
jgi:hypothetical protein